MKQSAAALPSESPLIDIIERVLDDPGVSHLLWERALVGPAREFLRRPGKEFRARMVELCWRLGGGQGAPPVELPAAIELLHAGSLIVDDIEDGSETRRGAPSLHHLVGVPIALNTGNWLYFVSLRLIDRAALPAHVTLALYRSAASALTHCHEGQALDLSVSVFELSRGEVPRVVRAITARKTGGLMQLAAELGAIGAGAAPVRRDALARFGRDLGVALQMLDDLGGVVSERRRDKGLEDLAQGRATWPWAWLADAVDEVAFAKFQSLGRAGRTHELLDAMRGPVAPARARVRARLVACLGALRDAVGDHELVAAVADELERLEQSYE